jgi:hypothetical protein
MEERFDLVWLQRLTGGMEVIKRDIPASEAVAVLQEYERKDLGPHTTVFLRPASYGEEETTETETTIEVDVGDALAAALEQREARVEHPIDWAIVSLMGHTSYGCQVRAGDYVGVTLFQLTIPREGTPDFVTYINPATALFGLTPVAEDVARNYARDHAPFDPAQHYRTPDPRTAVVDEDFDDERPDWADDDEDAP